MDSEEAGLLSYPVRLRWLGELQNTNCKLNRSI